MASLIIRTYEAYKTGGWKRVRQRTGIFLRRRYYRILSRFEAIQAEFEPLHVPSEVVAGCMYKVRFRITNRSKITWNEPHTSKPIFAAAAQVSGQNGIPLRGPHLRLPENLASDESCEITLIMEVPRRPGQCRLQVDIVRENCYWLRELGKKIFETPIKVSPHSVSLFSSQIPALDITMDVTNKCPLKCIQCRKTYFEVFEEQQDMNWDLFRKVAAEVFPYARSVMLSSAGEPLMTRNFLDAIEITRKYGVREVSFITAGLHLNPKRAERILDLGVTRVEFSLDGASAEVYNKIRIGSSFDKVIKNIAYLNELKKKRNSRIPLLRFNFVLMKSNIHELPTFIDLAASLGVEEVQTQHMVIFTEKVREEALIFDKERSNHFIELAKKRAKSHEIVFFHPPLFNLEDPQENPAAQIVDGKIWIQEDPYSFERKTHPVVKDGMQLCTDPWRKLYLDWQGLVFPCCVWKEEPLGDIRKNSFREIWESARYKILREGLVTGKLGKSCAECSVITGGDINNERSYFFY